MKNFSLKALGALLFAAGLVVAGVSAPAFASTGTLSVTSFTANTQTPAMIATASAPSGTITDIRIQIQQNFGSYPYFPVKGICPPSTLQYRTSDWSQCGINDIQIGNVSMTSSAKVGNDGSGYMKIVFDPPATAGAILIDFASGAFSGGSGVGNYNFTLSARDAGMADLGTYTQVVTVVGANQTVTFNGNGADGGSTASQTANTTTALTLNGFTKTGYTFGGWATTQARANDGIVFKADGATWSFASPITLYAIWTASSSGGGSSASANLTLNATTGQLIAGSTVGVSASGLQSTAAYTVTVQSTPQTIGSGNAVSGAVSTNVTLPSGLEAGWHTLTFTSTAADGSAVESKYYFKISASGTLLSTSSTIPAELANPGVDSASAILLLAGGLSLALVGAEMFMIARRKRSN